MAGDRKYPVTGRDTPAWEIVLVLGLSALVILWATRWRVSGEESWRGWLACALAPGVLLRWLEIVRRTRWIWVETAVAAVMTAIAGWGFMRLGGFAPGAALALFAALLAWLVRDLSRAGGKR